MSAGDDFHKDIVDNLHDGVYYVDRRRTITYWNRGAARITGYRADEVVGHRCFDNLLRHVDGGGRQLCFGACPLVACMRSGEPTDAEVYLRHRDGHRVPVLVRAAPIRDAGGAIVGAVEIFDDNTPMADARREIDELRRVAQFDAVTGLRNRDALELSLRFRCDEAADGGRSFGLLFVDVDRFKQVNDEHGHAAGDALLAVVGRTLVHAVRSGDVVGRWGGEEFVAITEVREAADLAAIAERVRVLVASSSLDRPGAPVTVTVSVGAALCRAGDTPESLVARADSAMYASKQHGRDRVTVAGS